MFKTVYSLIRFLGIIILYFDWTKDYVIRSKFYDVVGKLAQLNTLSLSYKRNVVSFRTTRSSDVVRLSVMVVGN